MYTQKEVATIAELIAKLIADRKIGFEMDEFGNPKAEYSKESADTLVEAITSLDNFPVREAVQNAMLDAALELSSYIFIGFKERKVTLTLGPKANKHVERAIYDAAFLEIPESLFTVKQIQAMLRLHPDYVATREKDIKDAESEKQEAA